MNSWFQYDNNISDHRPVALKLNFPILQIFQIQILNKELLKIVDVLGRKVTRNTKGTLFYIYKCGFVEKKISTDW